MVCFIDICGQFICPAGIAEYSENDAEPSCSNQRRSTDFVAWLITAPQLLTRYHTIFSSSQKRHLIEHHSHIQRGPHPQLHDVTLLAISKICFLRYHFLVPCGRARGGGGGEGGGSAGGCGTCSWRLSAEQKNAWPSVIM